jgi:predicted Zn-dependent peptidase
LDEIEKVGGELAALYRKGTPENSPLIKDLRERLRTLHEQEVPFLQKEQLAKIMLENGGSDYNANTSKDMTSYYVSLPTEKMKLWAELESERIFKPVFREFYEEKDVVLEERRLRVDNDPDGPPVRGLHRRRLSRGPLPRPDHRRRARHPGSDRRGPSRLLQQILQAAEHGGGHRRQVRSGRVKKLLEETFGKLTFDAAAPETQPAAANIIQKKETKVALKLKARPRLLIGYHKPTLPDDDDYIFDLIDQILGDGRSSRFYRSLVLERKIAASVSTSTGIPGSRLPNLFMIEVSPLSEGVRETS